MKFVYLGKVANTHGVRGDIKINPYVNNFERFKLLKSVYIKNETNKYTVIGCKQAKNQIILQLKELNSLEDAALLKNCEVFIDRKNAVKLPEDEYFVFDLVKCKIYQNDVLIGKLEDVISTGSNDVYVVSREGKKDLLIPALKTVVLNIDIENEKIDVKLPNGLLEIYD